MTSQQRCRLRSVSIVQFKLRQAKLSQVWMMDKSVYRLVQYGPAGVGCECLPGLSDPLARVNQTRQMPAQFWLVHACLKMCPTVLNQYHCADACCLWHVNQTRWLFLLPGRRQYLLDQLQLFRCKAIRGRHVSLGPTFLASNRVATPIAWANIQPKSTVKRLRI